MSDYSDFKMIEQKLRDGMVQGEMHHCLRDIGRIAGGHVAAGRLTQDECDRLGEIAQSLAINQREAARKWNEAVQFGYRQPLVRTEMYAPPRDGGHAVGWDESVSPEDFRIVNEQWLERETVIEPSKDAWSPCSQLSEYIRLLFKPGEKIMFCTDPWKRDGEEKWIPNKGSTKTYEEMLKYLGKNSQEGFDEAVGTLNNETSGAWIRINPFDGNGAKDENVTDYRYALIESDNKPIDEQVAIYRKLELPCKCIVHSGGKSAHAIVRVEAADLEEYRKRVDFLYKVCSDNGLPVDKQNRNPSRYSRMPGVIRNGKKQFIITRECGKASWEEWENWIQDQNDDLPDFEPLTAELFNNPPEKAPELISGVLRIGDNMIISGPPKAGKSFLLIDLCIAIATGGEWIGHKCTKGNVLYINLELNKASCVHRIIDVCKEKNIPPPIAGEDPHMFMWNLRGKAKPIDTLAPRLIRRVNRLKNIFSMIVIDPAYLVFPGDENSASDTGTFMRSLIQIAAECKSTIVLCHHHSKGSQGDKRSMDRSSGSGVFSRSPDAILDLLPLEADTAKQVFCDSVLCEEIAKAADIQDYSNDWRRKVSQDDMIVVNKLIGALGQIFDANQMDAIYKVKAEVEEQFESVTGWRVSYSLRDFKSPAPKNLWFRHPCHVLDEEGNLKDASPEGGDSRQPWKKRKPAVKVNKADAFKRIIEADPNDVWTLAKATERFQVSERQVKRYLKQLGWAVKSGVILVEGGKVSQDDMPF